MKHEGQGSAIGGQQSGNVTYGVMPEQITAKLQENPGAEFIVIQQVRQGETPKLWTSGDPEQTKSLFRDAYTSLAFDTDATQTVREPATA